MTHSEPTAGPVTAHERIHSLDILRGFAVLGILVMNIQSFSMVGATYLNPTAYGNLEGANYGVWLVSYLLADRKMMAIFSMLFGAGVVLLTRRREDSGQPAAGVHYRRMFWLLVFGVLHGFLLWYGDILHAYAVCGLGLYLVRKWKPRRLIIVGLLVLGVASALTMFWQVTMPYWPEGEVEKLEAEWWQPDDAAIADEVEAMRGSWLTQQQRRIPETKYMQTTHLLMESLWRAGGLMLIGMALFKLGIFSAERSRRFYIRLAVIGFGVGLPVVAVGAIYRESVDWDVRRAFFFGGQPNYWASLLVALGWVGLVMLFTQSSSWGGTKRRLAAVGRMALTGYLMQTIICTTIFYGHGLGFYGKVERTGQALIVLAIWVLLLVACPIWLRFFRFGPFEWLWRCLTYMRIQPMRISARTGGD